MSLSLVGTVRRRVLELVAAAVVARRKDEGAWFP